MKLPKNHAKESKKVQSKQKQNRFEMFTQFLHLKYRASFVFSKYINVKEMFVDTIDSYF